MNGVIVYTFQILGSTPARLERQLTRGHPSTSTYAFGTIDPFNNKDCEGGGLRICKTVTLMSNSRLQHKTTLERRKRANKGGGCS